MHLKRFSSSRTLRDKIDELVEFPIEGLDLTKMAMERAVRRRLRGAESGRVEEEGQEPLLYDLFAVDEHLGGEGGEDYRAYALNHGDGTGIISTTRMSLSRGLKAPWYVSFLLSLTLKSTVCSVVLLSSILQPVSSCSIH